MSYRLDRTGSNVEALLEKIEALVVDTEPTADSDNPVSSGGVKAALDGKVRNLSADNVLIGFNYSNVGVTPSGISLETDGSAIGIGQNVVVNTSGTVKINGSEVATTAQLSGKVDKESGKGLSTNDFTNGYKSKVDTLDGVISVDGTTKTEVSSEEEAVVSGASGTASLSVNPMGVQVDIPNSSSFTYNGKQVATRDQIPEYVSQLTNDRGYIRMADLQEPLEYLLGQKQDKLTFDNVPTADSDNPVKSGGVKTAIDAKQDTISDLSTIRSGASAGATAVQPVANATENNSASIDANGNIKDSGIPAAGIPFGKVDSTSTATAFTATVDGITELKNGICVYLMNGVVTSAAASTSPKCFTLNINDLGAKPVYYTTAAASYATTQFNVNSTMLFVYNTTRVSSGCWDLFYGFDSNTNTLGYQLRTNSSTLPAKFKTYRYRLLFTSADHAHFVAANASTSTNADAAKTPTTEKIDPFGPIVYYGYTTAINANANFGATYLWTQYTLNLGYSFNTAGAALTLTFPAPVYVKAAPQSDGSAIIDATTPYVQALPSTEDGKIYIFLGIAYGATNIELRTEHPVYYYKDGAIRLWSNASEPDLSGYQETIDDLDDIRAGAALGATALQSFTETDPTVPAWAKQSTKPSYTAEEVGALPSSTTIPTKVSDLTNDSGFTTNTGTITGITMNGASKGTSGVVNLGTVITAHQDISGKADVAALAGYTPTSGFATINGASITGGGNIVITAGSSSITTIDATPTSGSTNPVQSGGVYDAIEGGFYY